MGRPSSKRHPRSHASGVPQVPRRAFASGPPRWWVALMLAAVVTVLVVGSALNVSYVVLLVQRAPMRKRHTGLWQGRHKTMAAVRPRQPMVVVTRQKG